MVILIIYTLRPCLLASELFIPFPFIAYSLRRYPFALSFHLQFISQTSKLEKKSMEYSSTPFISPHLVLGGAYRRAAPSKLQRAGSTSQAVLWLLDSR